MLIPFQAMSRQFFGTDGVRGLANRGSMTPEVAMRIGAAVTHQAREHADRPRIVVGKDTRLSGYLFETAITSGICAMGGKTLLSGPLPTPAIAHLTVSMRASAGIVISASHNPYQDNGIKIFGPDGFKLPDERELELESMILEDRMDKARPVNTKVGVAERMDDSPGRYVAFVKQSFPDHLTLDGVKVCVDAAHGAAYRVAPLVFSELGAEVFCSGVSPNGRNINRKVGALYPNTVAREVLRHRAHIGIALDGDADRVIIVDEHGREVDGDTIMALCARRMATRGQLKKKTVVATVMSNLGLEHALSKMKCKLVRTAVGDRYVVEAMRKRGFNFGGEQSGHLIFLDHATTGDGLVAAMQVLAILVEEGCPLSELADTALERVPQILVNGKFNERLPVDKMKHLKAAKAKVEKKLGTTGRVVVRWSGTEPKLRVMVEGPDEDRIRVLAEDLLESARRDVA